MIKALFNSSTSAILLNNIQVSILKTTIVVRQGCLLSYVLFNIFLEYIYIYIYIYYIIYIFLIIIIMAEIQNNQFSLI